MSVNTLEVQITEVGRQWLGARPRGQFEYLSQSISRLFCFKYLFVSYWSCVKNVAAPLSVCDSADVHPVSTT